MNKHEANYSKIVAAEDYNRMMTDEHLYIANADRVIQRIVRRYSESNLTPSEVLEIGCGPVRLTPLLSKIPNVHVTALDFDPGWVEVAQQIVEQQKLAIDLVCADIETYKHPKPVDIAVSQGSHHHIQKGEATQRYLENVRRQLTLGGTFIISDEMLAHYESDDERYVRLCIWYSHIISNALLNGYEQLAVAEMETLLDDIFEGSGTRAVKDEYQMAIVRASVHNIARLALGDELGLAQQVAEKVLKGIWDYQTMSNVTEAPLSRGDYKVCFEVLKKEVQDAGFKIREAKIIGPIKVIGGFGIYTLEVA